MSHRTKNKAPTNGNIRKRIKKTAVLGVAALTLTGVAACSDKETYTTPQVPVMDIETLDKTQEQFPLFDEDETITYADFRELPTKYQIVNSKTRQVELEGIGYGLPLPGSPDDSGNPTRYTYYSTNTDNGESSARMFALDGFSYQDGEVYLIISTADDEYSGVFMANEGGFTDGNAELALKLVKAGIVDTTIEN